MLTFLQKYLTPINLLLLLLLGLSAGILTGTLLESSLQSGTTAQRDTLPESANQASAASSTDLNLILQRNIFDPAGGSAVAAGTESDGSGRQQALATTSRRQNLTLLGTVTGHSKSLALVGNDRDIHLYLLGDELADGGHIEEIQRNLIIIRYADRSTETLAIEATPPGRPNLSATGPQTTAQIREIDTNKWLIPRETAEMARQNLAQELRMAQLQPRIIAGKTSGFAIKSMQSRSILHKIGLRRGDVILQVNGMSLTSPEKALQIFQQLREARQLSVDAERDGTPLNFAYVIE